MMKYAVVILAVLIQGIQSKNCTRTNTKKDFCVKSCDPSQNSPCKGNRLCLCDGDCGFSCVKADRRCPTPEIPANGRVRGKNTTFGSVIKYRCSSSYKLQGPKTRTCRGNGKWDGETPICKGRCTDPGDISNGRKQGNNYESGQKVKYTCSKGFTMQGSSTLTCKNTGSWNRPKPKCVCKRTNTKAFRYCKKSCNPKRKDCKKNNECVCDGDCGYSCVAKGLTCSRPVQIDNGNRQYTSTKFWSTVKYQCNKPYTLVGPHTRTCRGIRSWDDIDPVCKIICQDPGDITHGSKQSFRRSYDDVYATVGDRVEYNCYPGYKMEGSQLNCDKNGKCFKQLVCNKNGKWSGSKPNCTVPTCGPPQLPPNSELWRSQSGKTSYNYKERVAIKCKSGYFIRGFGYKTCDSSGWTGPTFSCSPKSCGHPGSISNGELKSYVFTFKSKVYYQCIHGYKLVGDKFRQCQANEQWSGRQPKCELIDCGVLPTPAKASKVLETHTRVDGMVRFKCTEKGYEISGSEIRKCLNTGLWSGTTTKCTIISCADPGSPINGKKVNAKNKYNYGDTLKFACNDNYTLEGNRQIKCEETKDWSGALPYCRDEFEDSFQNVNETAFILRKNMIDNFKGCACNHGNETGCNRTNSPSMDTRGRGIVLNTDSALDLVFVIDASRSVTRDRFNLSLSFAQEFIRTIGPSRRRDGTRIALVTFGTEAVLEFNLGDAKVASLERAIQEIGKVKYVGGARALAKALKLVRTVVAPNACKGSKRAMIFITDGKSNIGGPPEREAQILKEDERFDFEIYAVGVGKKVNDRELTKIASATTEDNHVIKVRNLATLHAAVKKAFDFRIDYSPCGESPVDFRARIVGGSKSKKGWWPWQVGIYKLNDLGINQLVCGGALISSQWVLTAGHCFSYKNINTGKYTLEDNANSYQLKVGDHNLKKGPPAEKSEKTVTLKKVYVHQDFVHEKYVNDIALVKLEQKVEFNRFVRTVCLPEKNEGDLVIPTKYGYVAGWGATKALKPGERAPAHRRYSNVLKHSAYEIQQNRSCGNRSALPFNSTVSFCAGDGKGGNDTCHGDSGGAFVREGKRGEKYRWIVTGLVSWGEGCGQENQYGYYTRVYPFIDWIKKVVAKTTDPDEREA